MNFDLNVKGLTGMLRDILTDKTTVYTHFRSFAHG